MSRSATKSTSAWRSRNRSSVSLRKLVADAAGGLVHCPLGVHLLLLHHSPHLVEEHRVGQDQPVRLDDRGVLLAILALELLLYLAELVIG